MEKTKKPFLSAIVGIVALSMLALMPAPVLADTFNVPSETYPTIQAGIDAAEEAINAGAIDGIVLVAPGTYNESIVMKFKVTVQGSDADETIIDGSGKAYAVLGASYSTISGFTITGSYYGIYNDSNSLPTMTITNNIITGNSYYGIYNPSYFSPTITNNIITANEYSGIYNASYSSPTITNNIITGNKWYGIQSLGASPQIENNNVVDNAFGSYLNCSPIAGDISEDPKFVYVDPLDLVNSDYHLQEGSPCIDSGANDAPGLPETDADGNPRIVDGDGDGVETVDMGAFEYQVEAAKANAIINCFEVNYVKVIDRTRYGAKRDKIEIGGGLELPEAAGLFDLGVDVVTVTINDKEITIPAGSLKGKHFLWLHYYCFRGDIGDVRVHMHLDFNRCRWWVKIYGLEASDLVRSETATVKLDIGKNAGEDSFEWTKRWEGRRMGFARFIEWPPIRCCGRWWWWR